MYISDLEPTAIFFVALSVVTLTLVVFIPIGFIRILGSLGVGVSLIFLALVVHTELIGFGSYWLVGLAMVFGLWTGHYLFPLRRSSSFRHPCTSSHNSHLFGSQSTGSLHRHFPWMAAAFLAGVVFLMVLLYGFTIDKINWTEGSGGFHFVAQSAAMLGVVGVLFGLRQCQWVAVLLIVAGIVFQGYITGGKGALFSVILVALYHTRCGQISGFLLASRLVIFSLVGISSAMVFYASSWEGLSDMGYRLLMSCDSVNSFASGSKIPTIDYGFAYHALMPITFKLWEPVTSIGPLLADISPIYYPENGGPNDSVYVYFMVSQIFDQALVLVYTFCVSVFFIWLDTRYSSLDMCREPLTKTLILFPVLISSAGFYQAVGTQSLLLARYFVMAIPIILLLNLLSKKGWSSKAGHAVKTP